MTQTQNRDSCVLIHILKLEQEEKERKEAKWAVVAPRGSGVFSLHKITKDYRLLWENGCSGDGPLWSRGLAASLIAGMTNRSFLLLNRICLKFTLKLASAFKCHLILCCFDSHFQPPLKALVSFSITSSRSPSVLNLTPKKTSAGGSF